MRSIRRNVKRPTVPSSARSFRKKSGGFPEKYRAVVALCYWEGLTHEQAATQLGCPLGTVRSRLARARDQVAHASDASRPGAARGGCRGGA